MHRVLSGLLFLIFLELCRSQEAADCDQRLGGGHGTLESPNFPANYPNSANCVQTIVVDADSVIQLVFLQFETELAADYVFLYDGQGANKTLIAKLSGPMDEKIHRTFITETNILTVHFSSDLDRNFIGYYARYDALKWNYTTPLVLGCEQVNGTYAEEHGVIVSPLWPEQYPNGVCCQYRVLFPANATALQLHLNLFETEENADVLNIYKGVTDEDVKPPNFLKKLSGMHTGETLAFASDIILIFLSDLDRTFPGFSITYSALHEPK